MKSKDSFSLKNKTILITGGSSGIGKAAAIECAAAGAKLVLVGRSKQRLEDTTDLLYKSTNLSHEYYVCDLSVDYLLTELVGLLPTIDGVVFSAGVGVTKTILFYNRSDFKRIFDINFFSPVFLTKLLVKNKKLNKGASLVYLASIAGINSFKPGNGIYGTSKSALNSFVKFAAVELSGKQFRFNSICPAMVETPFVENVLLSKEEMKKDQNKYLLKRYARSEEIAHTCLFLLSEASSYMTGQELILDGGCLLT